MCTTQFLIKRTIIRLLLLFKTWLCWWSNVKPRSTCCKQDNSNSFGFPVKFTTDCIRPIRYILYTLTYDCCTVAISRHCFSNSFHYQRLVNATHIVALANSRSLTLFLQVYACLKEYRTQSNGYSSGSDVCPASSGDAVHCSSAVIDIVLAGVHRVPK